MSGVRSKLARQFQGICDKAYGLAIKGIKSGSSAQYRDRKSFSDGIKSLGIRSQYSYLLKNNILNAFNTDYGLICIGFRFPDYHSDPVQLKLDNRLHICIDKNGDKKQIFISLNEFKERTERLERLISYYRNGISKHIKSPNRDIAFKIFLYVFFYPESSKKLDEVMFFKGIDFSEYRIKKQEYRTLKHEANREKRTLKKSKPKLNPKIAENNLKIEELKRQISILEEENRQIDYESQSDSRCRERKIQVTLQELAVISENLSKLSGLKSIIQQDLITNEIANYLFNHESHS